MILLNGHIADRIAIQDRGLQYGDGLFETIAYKNKHLEFLDDHIARLHAGCERLSLPTDLFSELNNDLLKITENMQDDAIIKIIITRGQGGRGYRQPANITPTRIVSLHPYPDYPVSHQQGVKVVRCTQIVSQNPSLAGLKHLNRLEQVLARSEWQEPDIAEGLMSNIHGEWIEGTMSNLFIVKQGQLYTPELTLSGINGVMRKQVMATAEDSSLTVNEISVTDDDLLDAEEAFLTNSIIGIWPITEISGLKTLTHGAITKKLQSALKGVFK